MTNSGLIVFLPLVGAVVGAIIGAWANSWYRDREAKKVENRELKALMTLIFAEYGDNHGLLKLLSSESNRLEVRSLTNLQTVTLDDSKVRLAQLLPADHVTALVRYYGQIRRLLDNINDEEIPPDIKQGIVQDDAKRAQEYGKAAIAYATKYLFVDHPEDTEDVHEVFVREAERIMNERPPEHLR
jgi:hypothetical protein